MSTAVPERRRPRHDPRETEQEILQAAEALLQEIPFREVTVARVMRRTGLKRPAFYTHFKDRHDLMLRVVQHIGDELFAMAEKWFGGDDPAADLRAALNGSVEVFMTHGPVLTALAEAAPTDERVEAAYLALVQAFVDASTEHIRAEQASGRTRADLDVDELARALVLLNERYLTMALGHHPQADPRRVADVLFHVWTSSLYGAALPSPGAADVAGAATAAAE
jgi:TetR/AcrR family transcriptional regulator, ethionamide resistance regulator